MNKSTDDPQYMTSQEAARLMRVSVRTFLQRIRYKQGMPKPFKPGGQLLWPRNGIQQFLESTVQE